MKPCNCGSGLKRREILDSAGIFVVYVCNACEEKVRSKYNPVIFGSRQDYEDLAVQNGEQIDEE